MNKICHLSSVHYRYDTRVFLKECRSLAASGYLVYLIVADGRGDEVKEGVTINDVGKDDGRLKRICMSTWRVYKKAILIDADLYHFHDPELIPIGLMLKLKGKRVVFDSHENVPKQLMSKPYLNVVLRWLLSKVFSIFERVACSFFDAVISATPYINDKFSKVNSVAVTINNYPIIGELKSSSNLMEKKAVCYIGGISHIRGIKEVVDAMVLTATDVSLILGGVADRAFEAELMRSKGWSKVHAYGLVDRDKVRDLLSQSAAGIVTFHPAPNHVDAQPNKMFEYMSAGVAVIASDFPLWREIIEGNDCGVCVNPYDSNEIAAAIDYLIKQPKRAMEMGYNGQNAVRKHYNWANEERKLLSLYADILG